MVSPESRQLVYSDAAVDDLEEIFALSIQEWGDDHFGHFRQELISTIRNLVHQPELGRERDDLALGIRALYKDTHEIVYRVDDLVVEILRVIHQRRDLKRMTW